MGRAGPHMLEALALASFLWGGMCCREGLWVWAGTLGLGACGAGVAGEGGLLRRDPAAPSALLGEPNPVRPLLKLDVNTSLMESRVALP
jgi:hypothetical protein